MSAYPRMFALLDVERAREAFSTFAARNFRMASAQNSGGRDRTRLRDVPELAHIPREDLAWLYEAEYGRDTGWADREVYVPLRTGSTPGTNVAFHIHSRFRPVIAPAEQDRLALIQIDFDGRNGCNMLATQDPPHDTVLEFLRRVQPVHAFVTLDHWNPGDDLLDDDPGSYRYFRETRRRVFDSTFLGPDGPGVRVLVYRTHQGGCMGHLCRSGVPISRHRRGRGHGRTPPCCLPADRSGAQDCSLIRPNPKLFSRFRPSCPHLIALT